MLRALDVGTSIAASLARGGAGAAVGRLGSRPERRLELFEFEGCPFCRKVREALSILDLEAVIYPCPKNGPRFRPELGRRGGREQFPYLVDHNTGKEMYESDDIVRYLFETYGNGRVPFVLAPGPLTSITEAVATLWRPGRGTFYVEARPPERPLELWSFEASPFCRIVREALCSLELEYVLHNVARGSPSRAAFAKRSGKLQVPWLYDPNTGTELFESADIVHYLESTYGGTA